MDATIKKYREDAIKQMVDDIRYLEDNGIDGDDLWDGIDLNQYSYYSKEEDKVEAFRRAGYDVTIEKVQK